MAIYSSADPKPAPRRPGEGTARRARARAIAFMVIALACGLSAAFMIKSYLARQKKNAIALPTTRVAVAAIDLPLATTLRADMVRFIDWPAEGAPQGSHPELPPLIDRVTAVAVMKGEALVEGRLAKKGTGLGMAAVIPANSRAMTVHVNEVIGVGGFIHPGDYVDVITTMQTPIGGNGSQQEYRSKIVLQNIRVLATGEDMVTQNAKPVKVPVVTLLVTPDESERLALASTQGKVQLTMRSQADQGQVQTPGISPPELLGPGKTREPVAQVSVARSSARAAPKPVAPPAAKPAKTDEVVEVIRGDRFEERKMRAKENP